MNEKKPYDTILLRDGLSNSQREATVLLNEKFVLPDERSLTDIFNFAKEFAKSIHFYDHEKAGSAADNKDLEKFKNGNWEAFFDKVSENELLDSVEKKDFDPHLALFLAFVKLLGHAREHLNGFIQRHLHYYYTNVLNLRLKPRLADNVYLIFELAKNANDVICSAGTIFNGEKSGDNTIEYRLSEDVVLTRGVVETFSTVTPEGDSRDMICIAGKTDTSDGIAKKLPEGTFWDAFGLKHIVGEKPTKNVGFAIASPLLLLKEGSRTIKLEIQLAGAQTDLRSSTVSKDVQLFFTGAKSWLGPFNAIVAFGPLNQGHQLLKIEYTLTETDPSVVPANLVLHGDFATSNPVMQVLFNTQNKENIYGKLKGLTIHSVNINLEVTGVTGFTAENDLGVVNPEKPFQPFGPIPKEGSSFTIYYDELMQKNVTDFSFNVNWLGTPKSFGDHYKNYDVKVGNDDFTATYALKKGTGAKITRLFDSGDASKQIQLPSDAPGFVLPSPLNVSLAAYPTFHSLFSNPNYERYAMQPAKYSIVSRVATKVPVANPSKGFVRFELSRNFLHDKYVNVFTSKAKDGLVDKLPLEPYTPVIAHIAMNYKASSGPVVISDISFEAFNKKQIQFFHLSAFGHSEQHGYLKKLAVSEFIDNGFAFDTNIYLVPGFAAGEFFIGLRDVVPGQSISLLFQLFDGSSNPDKDPATIEWSVLSNNEWCRIGGKNILKDETINLSRSGILNLVIPECATVENTLMSSGLTWLRAATFTDLDRICFFNVVVAQAATASRVIHPGQPDNILPAGKISKMLNKPSEIKSVRQPFASFGGRAAETMSKYRMRVSERLRHKGRAVTNWDYEHMVLENFPELYKVKCLNHFNDNDDCCRENQPGNVTLVVVPRIINNNAYNPFEPKVHGALREKIREYLSGRISFFTKIFVSNPDYESVQFDFKVKFKAEGNFGMYSSMLNEHLKKYLTPWAYSSGQDLKFGGAIKKSVVLNFIEEFSYVDFVTELFMFHISENGDKSNDLSEVVISNPKAILITHCNHVIRPFIESGTCS